MIARGYAAELSVARSTNASKLARSRCKANLSFSKTRGAEEMFVAKQQLTSLSPPLVNNTNTETKSGFVLFFSNEYFGVKVDLDGKKKKPPGV